MVDSPVSMLDGLHCSRTPRWPFPILHPCISTLRRAGAPTVFTPYAAYTIHHALNVLFVLPQTYAALFRSLSSEAREQQGVPHTSTRAALAPLLLTVHGEAGSSHLVMFRPCGGTCPSGVRIHQRGGAEGNIRRTTHGGSHERDI